MNGGPANIGTLIVLQVEQLVLFLPVALLTIWLLRTRWLAHVQPSPLPRTTLLRQVAVGALSALGGLAVSVLPAVLAGSYAPQGAGWRAFHYEAIHNVFSSVKGLVLLFGAQSLFEESLFRGIGLPLLAMLLMWVAELVWLAPEERRFASTSRQHDTAGAALWHRRAWLYCGLIANVVLSAGFALMHSHNPNVSAIALVNIMLAGLWLGLLFWRRVSLLACWAAHFAWNLGLSLLGLPVSGFALYQDPLGSWGLDGARPDLLSGGAFGPEASLPAAIAFAVLSALLCWLLLRQSKQAEATAEEPAASESRAG